jgi:hypothetical protein
MLIAAANNAPTPTCDADRPCADIVYGALPEEGAPPLPLSVPVALGEVGLVEFDAPPLEEVFVDLAPLDELLNAPVELEEELPGGPVTDARSGNMPVVHAAVTAHSAVDAATLNVTTN